MKTYTKGKVTLIQADCMDIMKDTPDNYYDLAIVAGALVQLLRLIILVVNLQE